MSDSQPGSCEPCKKKKCKCDRQLPHCGQCALVPSLCKYSENNKRGLPGGYLNTLEQRLSDTESALYNAVAELRRINGNPDSIPSSRQVPLNLTRSSKTTKTSKLAEWAMYPLKTSEDVERWWMRLREEDHVFQECSISPSPHATPATRLSFREADQDRQQTDFHPFEGLMHSASGNNPGSIGMAQQVFGIGTSPQDASQLINPRYSNNLAVSPGNGEQETVRQCPPYANSGPETYVGQGDAEQTILDPQINDAGFDAGSNIVHDHRGGGPPQSLSSTTYTTPETLDERLVLARHLSSAMQDTYY